MSFSTITTKFYGISMTWTASVHGRSAARDSSVGYDPVSKELSIKIENAGNREYSSFPSYDENSREISFRFQKSNSRDPYTITVPAQDLNDAKIVLAFKRAITALCSTAFFGGAALGFHFSNLSAKVRVGSYMGLAISIAALGYSAIHFQRECFNFAAKLVAATVTAKAVREQSDATVPIDPTFMTRLQKYRLTSIKV